MSASVVYALAFYLATAIFIIGVARKIVQYAKTPAPLKIPTMPAPVTQGGVVVRMFSEVVLFNSLFKSNKWIWIFGWMFHFALLLALFRHLRYVISADSFLMPVIAHEIVQSFGKYAGFAMLTGLTGLFARRLFVDRVRYISSPSDYLMLLLIMGIATTGLMMSFAVHTDIVLLKEFMLGLLYFNIQPLPSDWMLLTHLAFVIVLMVIFPVSKLLHAPGVFFSPTRNQVDNTRTKRHLAPWAAELEADRKAGE
jgi:[DsrC]-trisulfide reductase subunit M